MRALLVLLLVCQDKPHVDPVKVEEAIQKGASAIKKTWLGKVKPFQSHDLEMRYDELMLLTLHHAGVAQDDPDYKAALDNLLQAPLEATYVVSLHAALLEELNPKVYQWRIAQCAQFLVDNQCENGMWSYGEPTKLDHLPRPARVEVETRPAGDPKRPTRAEGDDRPRTKILIRPQRTGPASGDNSNSQYAALGLRSCVDANVLVPKETIQKALDWWTKAQNKDGGWCYGAKDAHDSYGSMSSGAVGSIAIYRFLLGQAWQRDKVAQGGIAWLDRKWTVKQHPGNVQFNEGKPMAQYFYYMYALERMGTYFEIDKVGGHGWYEEGALELLAMQKPGGVWEDNLVDTCFAILFLRHNSRPLKPVATESAGKKK